MNSKMDGNCSLRFKVSNKVVQLDAFIKIFPTSHKAVCVLGKRNTDPGSNSMQANMMIKGRGLRLETSTSQTLASGEGVNEEW